MESWAAQRPLPVVTAPWMLARGGRRKPGELALFKRRFPQAKFWLTAGLQLSSAVALAEAGIFTLADLQGATTDQLLAIQGVGPRTLETLEELLGHPLPGFRPRWPRTIEVLPEETWRRRGIPSIAAITFAQQEMTLDRLASMTREELLALPFVGQGTVAACELILGRPIPSRTAHPVEEFWASQGFSRRAARTLRKAGFETLEDLQKARWREDLPAGDVIVHSIERLLGREIPKRSTYWRKLGLSAHLATRLGGAGLFHLDDVAALSQDQFLARSGLGPHALAECERLLGRRLPAVRRFWLRRGFSARLAWKLAQAGINNPEALAAADGKTLRKAGLGEEEIASCRQPCRGT